MGKTFKDSKLVYHQGRYSLTFKTTADRFEQARAAEAAYLDATRDNTQDTRNPGHITLAYGVFGKRYRDGNKGGGR